MANNAFSTTRKRSNMNVTTPTGKFQYRKFLLPCLHKSNGRIMTANTQRGGQRDEHKTPRQSTEYC